MNRTAPTPHVPTAPAWRVYAHEARAQITAALRTPQFLVPSVLSPVLFFALFGVGLAKGHPEITRSLLATYAVFAAIGPAVFGFGVYVATERETGMLDLKLVSPMPPGAYVAGRLAASIAATLLALAGLMLVAAFAGVALPAWRWAALVGVGACASVPFALIGMNLGLRLGTQGATAAANVVFLSFSVLGGLWMPLSVMPAWIGKLAWVLPSFHLGRLSLMLMGSAPVSDVAAHVSIVLAIVAVAAAGAWAGWRREAA